jgi:hypothetical protein
VIKKPTTSDAPAANTPGELSLADTQRLVSGDPYNNKNRVATPKPAAPHKPVDPNRRRSLDDMRQLSQDIRSAPTWVSPKRDASQELAQNLAGLRVELERALAQLRILRTMDPDPSDQRAAEMMEQLRDAARHLEQTISALLPPDRSGGRRP